MNNETQTSQFFTQSWKRLAASVARLAAGLLLTTAIAAPAPAPLDQAAPAMASGNGVTLAVWQDSRNGAEPDIFGARLDDAGRVISSFAICAAPGRQVQPAVACNGTDFLVVWVDYRNGPAAAVYAARVTAAGAVLDAAGFPVLANIGNQLKPAVATDGNNYLVVWQEGRSQTLDIFGARVAANGTILDPGGIVISQGANNEVNPSIAGGSGGYLVTWQDYRSGSSWDIYGTLVNTAGSVLTPAGLSLSTAVDDQLNPVVSADGAGFMVAWQDFRSGSNFDIYGTRVASNGTVSNPNGIAISTAANDQTNPSLAWNGTGHLAAWTDGRAGTRYAIYAARITSAGAVSDTAGLLLNNTSRDQYHPTTAGNGGGFWVAWQDLRDGGIADIYGTRLANTGSVSDPAGVLISTAAITQTPVISWAAPASIVYGTALSAAQLNATANVPGTFQYTPAAGTVLGAGNQTLSVLFTPADTQAYTTAAATVPLNVARKDLSVTATSAARLYGASNPTFTGTLAGVVNNDPIQVSYTCPATAASPVGSYPITPTLSDPNGRLVNYTLTSANGTLTVNRAPLTIRADDQTKEAGQPNPALTATYLGFVNGDTAANLTTPVSLTTTATVNSPAGTYPIVASGASSPNYAITFVNGTLTVTPASVGVVSLTIQPAGGSILAGQTQQFAAVATYSDGSSATVNSGVTWNSSSPGVASVNSMGLATGLSAGTTTITAQFEGKSASASLTVASTTQPSTRTFTNSASIKIRDANTASAYPSTINVSGMSGTVAKVTVRLVGLSHKCPDDIDVLLVGPGGQKVVLMSDAGESEDAKNLTFTFDDAATTMLSDKEKLRSGTFRPTNYGTGDTFRAPAPPAPYGSALSAFNGVSPNGNWQMYIVDDLSGDGGTLAGGWSITITTQ